jgi:asparagine synthase (glutamine-hydrolysing)
MCGIAGYIGRAEIGDARVRATLDLMARRGPDHRAFARLRHGDTNVLLLHSRLSIIDLEERSNQPFCDGSRVMVFNGEIYNYVELKQQLVQQGHSFATTSDTEVLLRALGEFGVEALDRCEGMWAFALFDTATGSLLLSRDRFGEKPLYLLRDATGLYFGSEVKFIQQLAGRRLLVNYDHVCRFLVNGYKSLYKGRESFFHGLEEVPPAGILTLERGGRQTLRRYWQPGFHPDEDMSHEEAVGQVREALLDAVRIRLRADVPLAFCMSGGVDSNSLIAIARNMFHYDVHGFTIVNSDARYDEQDLVEHAVAQLGIRHTAIPIDTHGFLDKLRTLVRQHDAPVYTITYYAHWLLMESIAAHGYRISLSGTAADELFTGYYDHHLAYLYEVRGDPSLHAVSCAAWERHVRPVVRNPHLGNPALFIDDRNFRDHIYLHNDEFTRYLRRPWSEPFREEHYTDSLLRNRMLNELFHEAVPVILHEDDLNAMYYSIENRSPFLDRNLFELCYRIPSRHLIRNGCAKAVLRDAMRGIVPDRILDNPRKVGFNAPIHSFLDVRDPEVRASLLDRSPIYEHVRRDRIEALLAREQLPNSESKFLFYFLTSKMFLEECAHEILPEMCAA